MSQDPQPPLETPEAARARLQAEGLRPEERVELWARIERGAAAERGRMGWRAPPRIATGMAVAAAAVAVTVLVYPSGEREPSARVEPAARAEPSGLQHAPKPEPSKERCELHERQGAFALPAQCEPAELRLGADRIALQPGTQLSRAPRGARLNAGQARFHIAPRTGLEGRYVVQLPGDFQVQVIGTVFTLRVQEGVTGELSVSEGLVELQAPNGTTRRVSAGQSARWLHGALMALPAPAPEPEPKPRLASPEPNAPTAPDLDAVLARLMQLRSQGRHAERVAFLKQTLSHRGLTQGQRKRLTLELTQAEQAAARDRASSAGQ